MEIKSALLIADDVLEDLELEIKTICNLTPNVVSLIILSGMP